MIQPILAFLGIGLVLSLPRKRELLTFDGLVRKDGNMEGLANILNARRSIFQNWNSSKANRGRMHESYFQLIDAITPWLIAEPAAELKYNEVDRKADLILNCSQSKFRRILTGNQRLGYPKAIIDFIPFGYDIDKLEIRLLENYPVVDIFVIYEAPVTQLGEVKPLLFNMVRNTPRFNRFKDKIVYFNATVDDVEYAIPSRGSKPKDYWRLEKSMRSIPVWKFRVLKQGDEGYELKMRVLRNGSEEAIKDTLVLQNDGDEIPLAEPLYHLKHCEWRKTIRHPIYMTCVNFRTSTDWVTQTNHQHMVAKCLNGYKGNGTQEYPRINDFLLSALFIQGPVLWDWPLIHAQANTFRMRLLHLCDNNMGMPSAAHLSSMAEPGELIMKEASVIEGSHGDLSQKLIDAGAVGQITGELLMTEIVKPRCGFVRRIDDFEQFKYSSYAGPHGPGPHKNNKEIIVNGSTTNPIIVSNHPDFTTMQQVFESAVPWAIRRNPDRYPFYAPRRASAKYAGLFARTSTHEWMEKSMLPSGRKDKDVKSCYPVNGP